MNTVFDMKADEIAAVKKMEVEVVRAIINKLKNRTNSRAKNFAASNKEWFAELVATDYRR